MQDKKVLSLFEAILELKNTHECEKFFGDLFTPAELKEFANRWRVAQMLDEKVPYEKITEETGMSSTTIARIQKWLNGKVGGYMGYRLVLNRMKSLHHTSPFVG
jgi:TrpR-related protein YerC/YecD